jgi:hypothetical protein
MSASHPLHQRWPWVPCKRDALGLPACLPWACLGPTLGLPWLPAMLKRMLKRKDIART